MDKILFEHNLTILEAEPQVEPSASDVVNPGDASSWAAAEAGSVYPTVTNTNTDDIAKTDPKIGFAGSIASKTLPAVLGYTQPLNSPSGFVFAMKKDGVDDMVITRKTVTTGLREVTLDFTNEVIQDIKALFGNNFAEKYKNYLFYDGADINGKNPFETTIKNASGESEQTQEGKLADFFINFATWRMSRETNIDFTTWLATVASDMGTVTIANGADLLTLNAAIGEMKAKVYNDTQKTGRTWVLSDPKTINYLLMNKNTVPPDNTAVRSGKRVATGLDYNYVFTAGETDYYQDLNITEGEVYVGLSGGPGEASIYYTPYKEYFVQGGEDYNTGQSNIFFRLRDDWTTNPIDAGGTANDSEFIVKASVVYTAASVLV